MLQNKKDFVYLHPIKNNVSKRFNIDSDEKNISTFKTKEKK